jgi:bacterioferritin (cytochrome b1)
MAMTLDDVERELVLNGTPDFRMIDSFEFSSKYKMIEDNLAKELNSNKVFEVIFKDGFTYISNIELTTIDKLDKIVENLSNEFIYKLKGENNE